VFTESKAKRGKNIFGAERKKELDITKIASVVKMIKHAVESCVRADYVLTDSWFTCWEIVEKSIKKPIEIFRHVYKSQNSVYLSQKAKTLFTYRNKKMTYKEIRQLNKKQIKRSRRFHLHYIKTVVNWNGQKVALCFTRRGKRGNWKTILSTDLKLSFNETEEIYQIRWTIEVFFKESKQMLGLGKNQSNDFDAQIADSTIVIIQYIFLSLRNRMDKYESLGKLFKNTKAEVIESRLQERLVALLIAILDIITELFEQVEEEIIEKIIHDEQAFEKIRRLFISPKNSFQRAA